MHFCSHFLNCTGFVAVVIVVVSTIVALIEMVDWCQFMCSSTFIIGTLTGILSWRESQLIIFRQRWNSPLLLRLPKRGHCGWCPGCCRHQSNKGTFQKENSRGKPCLARFVIRWSLDGLPSSVIPRASKFAKNHSFRKCKLNASSISVYIIEHRRWPYTMGVFVTSLSIRIPLSCRNARHHWRRRISMRKINGKSKKSITRRWKHASSKSLAQSLLSHSITKCETMREKTAISTLSTPASKVTAFLSPCQSVGCLVT